MQSISRGPGVAPKLDGSQYTLTSIHAFLFLIACLPSPFTKQTKTERNNPLLLQSAVRFSLSSVLLEPEQANASCNPPSTSETANGDMVP